MGCQKDCRQGLVLWVSPASQPGDQEATGNVAGTSDLIQRGDRCCVLPEAGGSAGQATAGSTGSLGNRRNRRDHRAATWVSLESIIFLGPLIIGYCRYNYNVGYRIIIFH